MLNNASKAETSLKRFRAVSVFCFSNISERAMGVIHSMFVFRWADGDSGAPIIMFGWHQRLRLMP